VKEILSARPLLPREKSLAIQFDRGIQSSDIHEVCVLYTISGGSCYRVVSRRTEPSGSSSSTNSCGILPPGGSVVKIGSKLSLTSSLLLPAPAPGGALSIHIKTQFPSCYFWCNDPFQDAAIARRVGRIGRRRLERIRSVFRKGRLQQITTTGKEGCGTGGDTLTATRGRSLVINH
jgi:hypothetical protein